MSMDLGYYILAVGVGIFIGAMIFVWLVMRVLP